jgi:hypothetical protein
VTATNGTGYAKGNLSTGMNGIDFNSRLGIHPIKGLDLDVQFMDGYKATKTYIANVKTAGVKSTLMQAMASYGTDTFRVGGNYLYNKDKAKSATVSTKHGGNASSNFATGVVGDEVKSSGWDVWAWAKIPNTPFGAFGRFEMLDNKRTSGGIENPVKEKITRFVAGLEYSPIKNVTFAAVVDMTKLKNRGGVSNVTDKDTRFGLYTQVKL